MFALSESFSMSGYQKRSGTFAVRLLILLIICVFGRPAEAETNIYVFVPGRKVFNKAVIAPGTNEPDLWFQVTSFNGVFDGNNFAISNLNCKSEEADYTGLFGHVINGTIKDLKLVNAKIDAGTGNYVGSLVGMNIYGTISGCSVQGGSVTGGKYVSGLVGYNAGLIMDSCSNTIVLGIIVIGGLVGDSWESINQCHSLCIVTGGDATGGLVGCNAWGNIADSYSMGKVSGSWGVGELVGDNSGIIIHCYSTDTVSGNWTIGGLVGYNRDGSITDSLWDTESSGQYDMCGSQSPEASGCGNASGKTTVEMQTASMFINTGWDFVDETANGTEDIWWIFEGRGYPRFAWELIEGESGAFAENLPSGQ